MLKSYFNDDDEYEYNNKKVKYIDDFEKMKEHKKKLIHPKDIFVKTPKGFKSTPSKYRRSEIK